MIRLPFLPSWVFLALYFIFSGNALPAGADNDLAGHWRFSNDSLQQSAEWGFYFPDLSGRGCPARLSNPDNIPLVFSKDYPVPGRTALRFDDPRQKKNLFLVLSPGKDQFPLTDPALFSPSGAMTITAVVKAQDVFRLNPIGMGLGPIGYMSFGSVEKAHAAATFKTVAGKVGFAYSLETLQAQKWTHVMLVLQKGQGYRYYINGRLNADISLPGIQFERQMISLVGNFVMQKKPHYFNGWIAEIKIWQRALTSQEASAEARLLPMDPLLLKKSASGHFLSFNFGEKGSKKGSQEENSQGVVIEADEITGIRLDETEKTGWRGLVSRENEHASCLVRFPARFFHTARGYPVQGMVLEIAFRDTIDAGLSRGETSDHVYDRPWIRSEFHAGSAGLNDPRPIEIASLGGYNENEWKVKRCLFPHSTWPLLRVDNDGYYTFRIFLPRKQAWIFPIRHVSLHELNQDDFREVERLEKNNRGFIFKQPEAKPIQQEFAVFYRDLYLPPREREMPIPKQSGAAIVLPEKRVARNETFCLSFSLSSQKNCQVRISCLKKLAGENQLRVENYRVINGEKLWSTYQAGPKSYGVQPDRLRPIDLKDSLEIKAGEECVIWMRAQPRGLMPAGRYQGEWQADFITDRRQVSRKILIQVDVLPFELTDAKAESVLILGPDYHRDFSPAMQREIYKNIAEHGIPVILNPWWWGKDVVRVSGKNQRIQVDAGELYCLLKQFREPAREFSPLGRETKFHEDYRQWGAVIPKNRLFLMIPNLHDELIQAMVPGMSSGSLSDYEYYRLLSTPAFRGNYRSAIAELNRVAGAFDLEFVYFVVDEPGAAKRPRIICDRLFSIIKGKDGSNGNLGQTWEYYFPSCRNPLAIESPPVAGGGAIIIPSLDPLVDFKVNQWRFMQKTEYNQFVRPEILKGKSAIYSTHYSQIIHPGYNRFLQGLYTHAAGLNMTAIYAYNVPCGIPDYCFDGWFGHLDHVVLVEDSVLAYPVIQNDHYRMESTMAYEGLAEGLTDLRYISTLEDLLQKNPSHPQARPARDFLDNFRSVVPLNKGLPVDLLNDYLRPSLHDPEAKWFGFIHLIENQINSLLPPAPPPNPGPSESNAFSRFRSLVTDHILALSQSR